MSALKVKSYTYIIKKNILIMRHPLFPSFHVCKDSSSFMHFGSFSDVSCINCIQLNKQEEGKKLIIESYFVY